MLWQVFCVFLQEETVQFTTVKTFIYKYEKSAGELMFPSLERVVPIEAFREHYTDDDQDNHYRQNQSDNSSC